MQSSSLWELKQAVETGAPPAAVVRLQPAVRVLPAALALGWSADLLFYGQQLGVSFPLFVLLLLGSLAFLARQEGVFLMRRNVWLVAPLLFFATMVAVRANPLLTFLNVTAVGALLGLLSFFYAAGRVERLGLLGYPAVLLRAAGEALARPVPAVVTLAKEASSHRDRLGVATPVARGVVLALPILLLFTLLLSAADSIFATYIQRAAQRFSLENLPELLWRLALILAVAWFAGGGLLYALSRRRLWPHADETHDAQVALPGAVTPGRRLGFGEGVTVLALVDLLFAAFVWVQGAYLFSGRAAAGMHFEAYREYARRGFGELVAVTVLTLCLILGLRWMTSKRTVRQGAAFNALCSLMIGLALVMLASAFQRLLVWEVVEFYINTGVRLYVRWFIVWLALAYAWLLVTLWLRQDRFAIGAFVVALGFLVTINVVNPDAEVAAHNLARDDDLSTRYLPNLSADAVPALAAGLHRTTSEPVRQHLRRDLAARLQHLERTAGVARWPSTHLARRQAHHVLLELRRTGAIP